MKYFLFFGLFISSLLCNGQIRENGDVELTPITGYSASIPYLSYLLGSSPVYGIHFGMYGDYFLNDRWSLRTGFLYQKMGANQTDFILFRDEYSERTNYITVPLTINLHFGKKRNWYFSYGVGVGFLTDANANYNNGEGFVNIKDRANSTQFGLNGGAGYKFQIIPNVVMVIESYNFLGVTPTTEQREAKNFYLSVNIGVVFKI